MQKPLFYDDDSLPVDLLHGRTLYRAFNITIELDTVRRCQHVTDGKSNSSF
jgi:hypothetical protein